MNGARALIAWPVLATQLVIFGTAAFALTLGRDEAAQRDRFIGGLTNGWRSLAIVNLVTSPLLLLAIAAGMAQSSWQGALPLILEVLRQTHAGRVWEWRLPVVLLLVIVALWPPRPRAHAWLLALVAGALLLLESLTSHAIDAGAIAVGVHFVHQTAAALWIGAVLGLWAGARREHLGSSWIKAMAPWVSRLAGWTVTVLILSGVITAYRALGGDASRILYSEYGRTLLLKLAAAAVVLLIGAYNRFILIPEIRGSDEGDRLLRNVGAESILLVGVIGLAALLANTPPVH